MFQTTREFLMNRQILFHETCMVIHIFPIDPVFIPVKIQLIQALLQNRVDGVVRGVRPCSGLSGNIRCHKVSPCSTRARGSMYPRPARLRPCAAQPHKGSAPRNITSAPRPPPCRMTMRRGLVAPGSLRLRLRRSRYFSTLFCNRARGKRGVDTTAKPMKSLAPPFREGQCARPLSFGCFSQSADGATVD